MTCKCGSVKNKFFTKKVGNSVGLYCSECGKWQKWLGKDEIRLFKHQDEMTKSKVGEVKVYECDDIKDRLERFAEYLETQIDKEMTREPISKEDALVKCQTAFVYEKVKISLYNIIEGRNFNEN